MDFYTVSRFVWPFAVVFYSLQGFNTVYGGVDSVNAEMRPKNSKRQQRAGEAQRDGKKPKFTVQAARSELAWSSKESGKLRRLQLF